MIDENKVQADKLGRILGAIKDNSDRELLLISQMSDAIVTISDSLTGVNKSLNYTNSHLTDVKRNQDKSTSGKPSTTKRKTAQRAKVAPSTIAQSDDHSVVINNVTNNVEQKADKPTSGTRKTGSERANEVTASAVKRKKPTFKTGNDADDVASDLTTNIAQPHAEIAAKQSEQVVHAVEETANILSEMWRDENGRLRHKSGRFASKDENKAYETAERERQKSEDKKTKGILARLFSRDQSTNKGVDSHGEVEETAGAAAGGSFFYAARDIYDLAKDAKEKIGALRSNDEDSNKSSASDGASGDSQPSNGQSGADTNAKIKASSDRKQELNNQEEQTEVLKEQTAEQQLAYNKIVDKLEDIDRNTQPQKKSLLESLSSLKSIFGGPGRNGRRINVPDIDIPDKDDKKKNKNDKRKTKYGSNGKGRRDNDKKTDKPNKRDPKKIEIGREVKPSDKPKSPKSVLDNDADKIPSTKGNKLLGNASKVAKAGGVLAAVTSAYSKYQDVKNDDSLSSVQKATQIASTSGGAAGGAIAGGAIGAKAGAAVGTMLFPGVGTVIGAGIGTFLGGLGGSFIGEGLGEKMGDGLSSFISSDTAIGKKLDEAWTDTIEGSEKALKKAFGFMTDWFGGDDQKPSASEAVDFDKNDSIEQRIDKYNGIIQQEADKNNLPPELIESIIRQESGGKADAKSWVGAQGLMQLMPGTAKDLGVNNSYDPAQNIAGGSRYMAQHINKYKGKGYSEKDAIKLGLASYNAGGGWVDAAIKKSGGSMDGEAVLASLRDPSLTFKGKQRSASNIKQSDDYVKKIYGNYAARVNPAVMQPVPSKGDVIQAKTAAITASAQPVKATAESVDQIDSHNRNMPKTPMAVTVTNNQSKTEQPATKTVSSNNTTNNGTSTTNNNTVIASNTVIPTDFEDTNLKLIALDLQ
ncbi:lytic transglycosylase domain-containing protein [Photobacterium leiognathi]|uniref:lytic transglycosylase domain-containing protein n=2 Tax=Photobacterium leiognathi TaxID=553611 RepID=UPI003AF35094